MKSKYFELQELVRPEVYAKYGEKGWDFFDPRLIETIDFLKEHFGWVMTANDYIWGGSIHQRGFRDNLSPIVTRACKENRLYCSAHMRGQAIDFKVRDMESEEARKKIIEIAKLLPYPIRLEGNVSWVHLDVVDTGKKVYVFQ